MGEDEQNILFLTQSPPNGHRIACKTYEIRQVTFHHVSTSIYDTSISRSFTPRESVRGHVPLPEVTAFRGYRISAAGPGQCHYGYLRPPVVLSPRAHRFGKYQDSADNELPAVMLAVMLVLLVM